MRFAGEAVTVKATVVRDATDSYPPCILVQFPYLGNEIWVRESDLVPEQGQYEATIITEPLGIPRAGPYGTLALVDPDPYDARPLGRMFLWVAALAFALIVGTAAWEFWPR